MKLFLNKIIPLAFIITIISCSKNNIIKNPSGDNKKQFIGFNISSFTQVVSDLAALKTNTSSDITPDSLKKIFAGIDCYIRPRGVNNRDGYSKHLYQLSKDNNPNYGLFSDSVPYGSYTAYFVGLGPGADLEPRRGDVGLPSIFSNVPDVSFVALHGLSGSTFSNSDAFVGDSINFEIDGITNNDKQYGINMKRIVGLIRLTILDATPSLNLKVTVNPNDLAGTYYYSKKVFQPVPPDYPYLGGIWDLNKISTGIYEAHQPNVNKPFTVTIKQYSNDGITVLKTKTINNVICQINKVTTVSGKFFSDGEGSNFDASFRINVDPSWSKDTIKIKY